MRRQHAGGVLGLRRTIRIIDNTGQPALPGRPPMLGRIVLEHANGVPQSVCEPLPQFRVHMIM